jgi:hypothetical protein
MSDGVPRFVDEVEGVLASPFLAPAKQVLELVDLAPLLAVCVAPKGAPQGTKDRAQIVEKPYMTEAGIGRVPDQALDQVARDRSADDRLLDHLVL